MDLFSATPPTTRDRQILSVSELNRKAKSLLEIHLPLVWIEGEISNFSCPRSGHWYFTLKDEAAQVRSAMFKGRNQHVRETPKEGDKVLVRARVSIYEGRGDFQLIAEHMESAGFGLLQRRFEELKTRLAAEGLFDESIKKPLPDIPKNLAIVTSPSGAAVRDVISVLERRYPSLPLTIIPTSVQGDSAPKEIIQALSIADSGTNNFDLIVLCRGGGSIEDLWAFNDEELARKIANLKTPLVSAIGHEVDFTIADFVADYRAPTPSAAAEAISPDSEDLYAQFDSLLNYLQKALEIKILTLRQQTEKARARLKNPEDKLQQWAQKLDYLDGLLNSAIRTYLQKKEHRSLQAKQKLLGFTPNHQLNSAHQKREALTKRLVTAIEIKLQSLNLALTSSASSLNIVSPLATLQRGYAIVKNDQGNIISSAEKLTKGDKIHITVAHGQLEANVTETHT